jgi:hypothetical protein
MKKTALLLIMCLFAVVALAQNGWIYNDGKAMLISAPENFSGYDGAATYLGMMVGKAEQGNRVLVGLYGDKTIHDFRDNQQYVIVSFDWGKDEKWRIKQVETNGAKYQFFVIVNADNFIKKLRSAKHIAISLPVYKEGVHTFNFGTGGYPLDW